MDESSSSKSFEAILNMCNEKKPLSLYCGEENNSSLCTKVFKPQDVIATVSKQLREIQKADTLEKQFRKRLIKSRQSDFVSINDYNQEILQCHPINKFETQCVTDTQLINLVDNAEAMVKENSAVSKDFVSTACHKEDNLNKICIDDINVENFDGVNNNNIIQDTDSKDTENMNNICDEKNELYIDEINTEVYKEFDVYYGETHNNNTYSKNINCVQYSNTSDRKYEERQNQLTSISKVDKKENSSISSGSSKNDNDFHLKDNFRHELHTDVNTENECSSEEYGPPSSPIFNSFRSKGPSPLIFPLDTFEKFESLAMPLMEDNINFYTTKYLINSRIKDNNLLNSPDAAPIIEQTTDSLIIDNNKSNKKILENTSYKYDCVRRGKDSEQHVNKSTCFEDEILFSSDEDDEHFQKCQKHLPLTCALKSSDYKTEVDLDETIFVGFQTGSDKCIQVSKESFFKAKSIFDDIDKENSCNLTITELVDKYDNNEHLDRFVNDSDKVSIKEVFRENNPSNDVSHTSKSKNCSVNVLEHTDSIGLKTATENINLLENVCDLGRTTNESNCIVNKREFMGFKTASNKRIKISEESLAKTSNFFEDLNLDYNNVSRDMTDTNIKSFEEHIQTLKNQSFSESINLNAKVEPDLNYDYINLEDQTLLEEFENESIEKVMSDSKKSEKENHYSFNKNSLDLIVKDNVYDSSHRENFDPGISEYRDIPRLQDTSKFFGFKTANNKKIDISSEALAKTKDLFNDIELEDISTHKTVGFNNNGSNFIEGHIRSKTKLTNKQESNCAKSVFKSQCYQDESGEAQPIFEGFKTASNKIVEISKEALLKTERIFQDIAPIPVFQDNLCNKHEESLNLNGMCMDREKNNQRVTNNEFDNISNEVLAKTKQVFQENTIIPNINMSSQTSNVNTKDVTNPSICRFSIGTPINSDDHQVSHGPINIVKNTDINVTSGFPGFKTANDKPVVVTTESVLKTRNIFENIDCIGLNTECGNLYSSVGKPGINELPTLKSNLQGFPGFKTARNKKVAISEEALAKTKSIFKDIEYDTNIYDKVSNRTVDHSLTAAKNIPDNTADIINKKQDHNIAFAGFQTASNKTVKVSDEAMQRSRKIFEEMKFDNQTDLHKHKSNISCINDHIESEDVENTLKMKDMQRLFGFKTVTDKSVKISEGSTKKSCLLFSNEFRITNMHIDESEPKKILAIDIDNKVNVSNTIDTQLLNNFEETLHTEDFFKDATPKQCKRSGSPILSCPKAKKRRKFETPYRSDINDSIQKVDEITSKKYIGKYIFSENYKKTKLYLLKDLDVSDENKSSACIDTAILNFDFESLLKIEFDGSRNDYLNEKWTIQNIKTCFLESVDSKIIPEGWLDNHLKLILWKLISYEVRFSNFMRGSCSVKNVLEQLKYRYDKELYRVERPALRKLLEKDDISTKTMILVIVGVYVDGVKMSSNINPSANVELLVSDGWYCVKACADRMLSRLVSEGKIAVGRKIATVGAELLNCEQGVSPWEDTSAVRLKLFGNSTRPAHWDARLGFYNKGVILSQLSAIDPAGGKVYKTRALVVRVYPALYVEKFEDGSTVTRPERLEHLYQIKFESERQNQLEKLYEDVEKEFFRQDSSESEGMDVDIRKDHQSGSQLNRLMKKSNDPSQFRSSLTESQAFRLQEYSSRNNEKIAEELQKRVQDKIRAQGVQLGRNVIPLLKIRVAGFEGTDTVKVCTGMVSIWRPNDAILDVVKEGTWVDMFNVIPTAVRNSEIQISAGRQSVFRKSMYQEEDKIKPHVESLQRKCYTTKELNKFPTMQTHFNEIDTVGAVFLVEPSLNDFEKTKGQQFQNVYLTDADKNFICINFWGGIKKFGYENIFDTGTVVACINLQKRAGNTRKSIPQYRATELSVFTKTPKLNNVRSMAEELIKKWYGLDKRKFCDDCVLIKNNYAAIKHGSEFSPYRLNTSDLNLTRNKIFIDSPLAQTKEVNLNLTGLDFESTFQQADTQEVSPAMLRRKQLIKEKIAKLKLYGEPPPLSKINFVNKSKHCPGPYKSPLISNVATVKNVEKDQTMTNKLIQPSPITSLNRTFVVRPGVNPVKLDFSAAGEDDDKKESNPFAEEFEVSPPLSLD